MLRVISISEATKEIQERFDHWHTEAETVSLTEAFGRILAQDIVCGEDIPGFDRSTMDGYAVRAADTFGASETMPAMLGFTQEVIMGQSPDFVVEKGQCAYVPTGGELPQGCDAVVMMEYVADYGDGYQYAQMPVAPGTNVIFRGDDIKKEQTVLQKGAKIRPQEIGTLAAMGIGQVPVYRRLKVGILSTGDELVDVDKPQSGAVVRDVNTYAIAAGLTAIGALPVCYGIVRDDYAALSPALQKALKECDAVIISGGSSVGTADITHRIIDEAGRPGVFIHGLAVKPGKPTIVGNVEGKIVFGLPGHPVSAYVIYRILAAPIFSAMMGQRVESLFGVSAAMGRNVPSNHGREEYIPVQLLRADNETLPTAMPVANKSGLISTLCQADGFVCIPRDREGLSKGDAVTALLF